MCQGWTVPVNVATVSPSDASSDVDWVICNSVRRSIRSARAPPSGASTSSAMASESPTSPTCAVELVSKRTCQRFAATVPRVPTFDSTVPSQYIRNPGSAKTAGTKPRTRGIFYPSIWQLTSVSPAHEFLCSRKLRLAPQDYSPWTPPSDRFLVRSYPPASRHLAPQPGRPFISSGCGLKDSVPQVSGIRRLNVTLSFL